MTEKILLNFKADDWLAIDLVTFKNAHPEIDSTKNLVQNYILSLKEQVEKLQTVTKYLGEQPHQAGKSADGSIFIPQSPRSPEPQPTQEPQMLSALAARIDNHIKDYEDWRNRHYGLAKREAQDPTEQKFQTLQRALMIREEHERRIQAIKTAGAAERRRSDSNRRAQWEDSNNPHGVPNSQSDYLT